MNIIQSILNVVYSLLILSLIIIIHELGHYTVGRLCGVGIEEFSVGFGPKLWQTRRKGILYSLRPVIVGGYVRFTGEDEQSDDPRAFNNAPVWKRFLTILAGPGMNFVLAWVVSIGILAGYGLYETAPVVTGIQAGTPAAESGIMVGDMITSVDGEPITEDLAGYERMIELINLHDPETPLQLTVNRKGETVALETGLYLYEDGTYKMGVSIGSAHREYSIVGAVGKSFPWMRDIMVQMLVALKNLFFRGEGLNEVTGTVGIVSEMSKTLNEGLRMALVWLMFISLNLGIVNLLPLPALDGGRLVLLIVEAIRRKPLPRDKEGMIHAVGLMLFLGLFVVLTWHDIMRIIHG